MTVTLLRADRGMEDSWGLTRIACRSSYRCVIWRRRPIDGCRWPRPGDRPHDRRANRRLEPLSDDVLCLCHSADLRRRDPLHPRTRSGEPATHLPRGGHVRGRGPLRDADQARRGATMIVVLLLVALAVVLPVILIAL